MLIKSYNIKRKSALVIVVTILFMLTGCSGFKKMTDFSMTPVWVVETPNSETLFWGRSSVIIGDDRAKMVDKAKREALRLLSEQIVVEISATVSSTDHDVSSNDKRNVTSSYRESIKTVTSSILSDWKISEEWTSPSGRYWVLITYSKNKYYKEIADRVEVAKIAALNALKYKDHGDYKSSLMALEYSLVAIEKLGGIVVKGEFENQLQPLKPKVIEGLIDLMGDLKLTAKDNEVVIDLFSNRVNQINFKAIYNGENVSSLEFSWKVDGAIKLAPGVENGGTYSRNILSFTDNRPRTVEAVIVGDSIIDRYVKGVVPRCKFSVSKKMIELEKSDKLTDDEVKFYNYFYNNKLIGGGNKVGFRFTSTSDSATLEQGFWKCKSRGELVLTNGGGISRTFTTVSTGADYRSGDKARENSKRSLIKSLVQQVQ